MPLAARLREALPAMRRRLLHVLLLGAAAVPALLAAGCGYEPLPGQGGLGETTQAADYYPFTAQGHVIHWGLGSSIRVEIPDCPYLNCFPDQTAQAVVQGISVWAPLHAELGLDVDIDRTGSGAPNDVAVIWDNGCGTSGYAIAPGVIGFAAIEPPPADPSRFIVMTSGCSSCGSCPSLPPSHDLDTIRDIAMHEWGHMLGVWNHSFDPQDLMYPFRLTQGGISNRDAHTLFQAYRFAPDLDLSSYPQNTWTQAGASSGEYLIRYVHSYAEPRQTVLEFNPPADW